MVCSNPQLVSQKKILFGDTLHDHIHLYCESTLSCIFSEIFLHDYLTEKHCFKLENFSEDRKTLYGDFLDDLAIKI